jgi:hypothetical protein
MHWAHTGPGSTSVMSRARRQPHHKFPRHRPPRLGAGDLNSRPRYLSTFYHSKMHAHCRTCICYGTIDLYCWNELLRRAAREDYWRCTRAISCTIVCDEPMNAIVTTPTTMKATRKIKALIQPYVVAGNRNARAFQYEDT